MTTVVLRASRGSEHGFSPKVIWGAVKQACSACALAGVAPHDLRRTCARLCHEAGGELEQIQFLLGHVSVQTTERYLGCKQRLRNGSTIRSGSSQSNPAPPDAGQLIVPNPAKLPRTPFGANFRIADDPLGTAFKQFGR